MTIPGTARITPAPGTVPADVRAGGEQAMQAYSAALAFERVLLAQLTRALAGSAERQGDEAEAIGGVATQQYREMLPDALADAIASGGGTGLAENLYRAMRIEGTQ